MGFEAHFCKGGDAILVILSPGWRGGFTLHDAAVSFDVRAAKF